MGTKVLMIFFCEVHIFFRKCGAVAKASSEDMAVPVHLSPMLNISKLRMFTYVSAYAWDALTYTKCLIISTLAFVLHFFASNGLVKT
jgi:hypothetical protein